MSTTASPAAATAPDTQTPGVGESIGAWWRAVHAALSSTAQVAVLEARVAAVRLGLVVALGIVIGLLVASAWLLLMGSVASLAIEAGLPAAAALALIALVNLLALWPLGLGVRWLLRGISFEATLRQLTFSTSTPASPSGLQSSTGELPQ